MRSEYYQFDGNPCACILIYLGIEAKLKWNLKYIINICKQPFVCVNNITRILYPFRNRHFLPYLYTPRIRWKMELNHFPIFPNSKIEILKQTVWQKMGFFYTNWFTCYYISLFPIKRLWDLIKEEHHHKLWICKNFEEGCCGRQLVTQQRF
jgi:hypothetical protein